MILHFAYGANMNLDGMRRRCASAQALGPACLPHHRFIVTADGYASLRREPGALAYGIVWKLAPRDLAALNIFESLDSGLYQRTMLPVRIGRSSVACVVYAARAREIGLPRPGYMQMVLAAARAWQLPQSYLQELERWVPGGWRARAAVESGAIA